MDNTFLENYIHLEKLCNDIYGNKRGITNYIEDYESLINETQKSSLKTDYTLVMLKQLRRKRNQYAHDGIIGYNEADTEWLIFFYDSIIAGNDPLSVHRKLRNKNEVYLKPENKKMENDRLVQTQNEGDKPFKWLVIVIVLATMGITLAIYCASLL